MQRRPHRHRFRVKPVTCLFCDAKVDKPKAFPENSELKGGRCACGAFFIADETGKAGGQILVDGLTLLCDGDIDRAMTLGIGTDYELKEVSYQPRTFGVEEKRYRGGSFGRPKLWFFKRL